MQIEHVDGWQINDESADGWYAVNTRGLGCLGLFSTWQEAKEAVDAFRVQREQSLQER